MRQMMFRWTLCSLLWTFAATFGGDQEAQALILRIKAVGKEGVGNVEASKALKQLVAQGPGVLTDVLAGMDDANPIAVNWLRGAVEAIAGKAIAKGDKISQ